MDQEAKGSQISAKEVTIKEQIGSQNQKVDVSELEMCTIFRQLCKNKLNQNTVFVFLRQPRVDQKVQQCPAHPQIPHVKFAVGGLQLEVGGKK